MKPVTSFRTIVFAVVALALLAGIVARPTAAQTPRIDLAVKRAVVRIVPERCFGTTTCLPQNNQPGSGVVIHPTGLILTAWHVLSADNDFQQENYWDDFVVEVIGEDDGLPPAPAYRARIVATRPEMDLAILRIDRDSDGRPVTDVALSALPWLPVYTGESRRLVGGDTGLPVLGFPRPRVGGRATLFTNAEFKLTSPNRADADLWVQRSLDPGYSGGPGLVWMDERWQVAGIVLSQLGNGADNRTKLRDLSIAFQDFQWLAGEETIAAHGVRLTRTAVNGQPYLQVEVDIHARGMEETPLEFHLLFFEAETGRPWQPAQVDLPRLASRQIYWSVPFQPDRPVYGHLLSFHVPLADVPLPLDSLAFRAKVARGDTNTQLWANTGWLTVSSAQEASPTTAQRIVPTATPERSPTPVPTVPVPTADGGQTIAGMEFVYVPAGAFTMGSDEGHADEGPVHSVDLDAFWIGRTEVTNEQYLQFVVAAGYTTRRFWSDEGWAWRVANDVLAPLIPDDYNQGQQPVVGLSWYEASAYAAWLAEESGLPVRLPTEAEWEKAARGETGRVYPWGDVWDPAKANYGEGDDGFSATAPVGSFPDGASPYGALDMAGNAWEWVADWYDRDYYHRSPQSNPTGPESGTQRILRGGSRGINSFNLRTTVRQDAPPTKREKDVGLRLALSAVDDVHHTAAGTPPALQTLEAAVRATLTAAAPTALPTETPTPRLPTATATSTPDADALIAAAVGATLTALAPTPTDTATPTHTPTATDTPDAAATFQAAVNATLTALAPTATNTATPTRTPTRTQTPTATRTATPRPPTSTPTPAAGAVREIDGISFVYVPAGEFTMGGSESQIDVLLELCLEVSNNCERAWFENAAPQHRVDLDGYWIGKTEVTNAQYRMFVEGGGYARESYWTAEGWAWRTDNNISAPDCWDNSDLNGGQQPVVCVSWYEAMAYSRWLSERSGQEVRLPTEAEWEKAARGTDGRLWSWGNQPPDGSRMNYCDANCEQSWKDASVDDGYQYTAPVGSYVAGASPYGALDMAGNVWEWTSTAWGGCDWPGPGSFAYPYSPDDGREDTQGNECRVLRGGAWLFNHYNAAAVRRLGNHPDYPWYYFGFRVVVARSASVPVP